MPSSVAAAQSYFLWIDDFAAPRQRPVLHLKPIEVQLLGRGAEAHWPNMVKVLRLTLADHLAIELHDLGGIADASGRPRGSL
jgi:hypothetical protein